MSTWLHEIERASIDRFVRDSEHALNGKVLDWGCGKQPYREVVELAGGDYFPWDRAGLPANVSGQDYGEDLTHPKWVGAFDTVLCTQVIQYVPHPLVFIESLRELTRPGGRLLITGPTTWPVVEADDLWRFTLNGVKALCRTSGWEVLLGYERASFAKERISFPVGWAVEAQR